MGQQINQQVDRFKVTVLLMLLLLTGCINNTLIDVNMDVPENGWTYAKSLRTTINVEDTSVAYNVFFKMRNTADYRYSNIYIIMRLNGDNFTKSDRYQYQLAQADGKWLGKGSGDLYSSNFLLLSRFKFPKAGKYSFELEQNMRDNPLTGISDVGITIEKSKPLK